MHKNCSSELSLLNQGFHRQLFPKSQWLVCAGAGVLGAQDSQLGDILTLALLWKSL